MDDGSIGLYVHVPFCERVCPYCDFAVVRARPLAPRVEALYVDALVAELAGRRHPLAGRRLASVYLGGGTPSLLDPQSVARIVAAAREAFPGPAPEEVTLEVNPSTVERARLSGFREAGVTRLSIGVQSFDDTHLRRLGRAHRAVEAEATIEAACRAGFSSFSLDLIFGIPGQTRSDLHEDLRRLLSFAPRHVSAYQLTVEPGTPYDTAVRRGQLRPPDDDALGDMFEIVEETLATAGLARYELSSYAQPGFESRHNQRYWQRRPVLGIGLGAWSTEPPDPEAPFGSRRANVRDLHAYLERIAASGEASDGPPERLDLRAARGEAVFLALRTRAGLDGEAFAGEFGGPPRRFYGPAIDELTAAGLLDEDGRGGLRLTARGRLLADTVFERFV